MLTVSDWELLERDMLTVSDWELLERGICLQ